ncbi:MAG: aminotransferase class V-fold PLP-dependent enzyme [Myxococcales bacterium]|nr:aminotransferase class V-fold PLP-dependent enzyme [Myxococcales bacterium]
MPVWTPGSPELTARWALDPSVDYLNHGSFGATPRAVLARQTELRAQMEAEPVEFLARRLPERLDAVRARVAAFVGADAEGLVLVPNATHGVDAALGAIDWAPRDEVVHANHGYNAVKKALLRLQHRHEVTTVAAQVPFPIDDPQQVVDAFARVIGPRTRLVVIDHVTSATALIFPVKDLVALCRRRGVAALVDGAHAPGLLPLDIGAIGADFYTGNLHKWVCAPKGAALFWVGAAWRDRVHARVVSHGYELGLRAEFEWAGTFDPTAWLSVPAALDHLDELGLDELQAHNHALVQEGRQRLARALGVSLPHPDEAGWYGPMAAVEVPWATGADAPGLTARLFHEHRIEVPFTAYDDRCFVRISGQAYNRPAQYQRLAGLLKSWR